MKRQSGPNERLPFSEIQKKHLNFFSVEKSAMEVFPREIQKLICSFAFRVPYNMFSELVKAEMHLRWFNKLNVYLGRFVDNGYYPYRKRLKKLPKFIVKNFPHGITYREIIWRQLMCWELVGSAEERNYLYDTPCHFSTYCCYLCQKLGYFHRPQDHEDLVAPRIRHSAIPPYNIYPPILRHTTQPPDQEVAPGGP